PLSLVLYVSVLKRAPLCVRQRSDVACALVRVHREEHARAENTESHVGAHKSIPRVGGGPRRKLRGKGSYTGTKLMTDNSNRSFRTFLTFAVNQFTITRGFPARSAIREIGADYAFQIDRENSSGYRFAAPFRDAFKRRNELRRHVGFAHNTAFDLSFDLLVSPVSLITFSLLEFWRCKAKRLSRSTARTYVRVSSDLQVKRVQPVALLTRLIRIDALRFSTNLANSHLFQLPPRHDPPSRRPPSVGISLCLTQEVEVRT
ncbi:hypothetical protein ALC56_09437, partial [Trachymyrmex septentrionalis]